MKLKLIVAGVLLVALIASGIVIAVNQDSDNDNSVDLSAYVTVPASNAKSNTNSSTYKEYAALKGEDFDKSYISNMIVHHQGAVTMAQMAKENAKHQEIKDLSANIISAQEKEIAQMQGWQRQWNYSTQANTDHNAHMDMRDHSGMGGMGNMMSDMQAMHDDLKGHSGDNFDHMFLVMMVAHHQSAIDMSVPAATNASHQEVKDLAKAVVEAQTSEIAKMQQWEKDWGYKS